MSIANVSVGTVVTGTTSASPSFGATTTAGNLLVAVVLGWASASNTITCSDGTWAQAVQSGSSTVSYVAIFYKKNCGAGETAPTFNQTGALYMAAQLYEFSGASTTAPLDQTGSASGTSSPLSLAASAADAASGNLVVTAVQWGQSKAGTSTIADSYNNGGTPQLSGASSNDGATSTSPHYDFNFAFTTGNSSADSDSSSSTNMNTTSASGVIATFKVAGSGTQYTQSVSGGLSFAGSLSRRPGKALAGALSFAGTLSRLTSRALTAALSFSGGITKKASIVAFTGGLSFSGAVSGAKVHVQTLTAGLSFTGGISKQVGVPLAGGLTFAGAIAKKVLRSIGGALSFTGATLKSAGLPLAGGLTFSGSLTRSHAVGKTLTGGLSFSGALTPLKLVSVISPIDSAICWLACGTGTLTDADAAVIAGIPNPLTIWSPTNLEPVGDATSLLWPANSALTAVWPAQTDYYRVPSDAYVWTGYIEGWPMVWDGPFWSEVDVTAVDAIEALATAEVVSTHATLTTAQGSNKDLTFTSLGIGSGNNLITVAYVNTGTLSVSVSGLDITVNINAGTTTASAILSAVNADSNANTLVTASLAPGSSGAGAPAAFTATNLAGGMFPQALSGAQIGNVLDNINWPSTDRAIDTGASTVSAVVYKQGDHQKAKTHINNIENSELGYVFVNPQGYIVYHDRNHRTTATNSTVVQATFGDLSTELEYDNVVPSYDKTYIYNYVGITPYNGSVAQIAQDTTSQNQYMIRSYTLSSQLTSAADALSLAQYIITVYKQPAVRFSKMTLTPMNDVGIWLQVFARTLGDLVNIRRRPKVYGASAGNLLSINSFLESVEWSISGGDLDVVVNWELSPSSILLKGLTLDDATLGKLDSRNALGL